MHKISWNKALPKPPGRFNVHWIFTRKRSGREVRTSLKCGVWKCTRLWKWSQIPLSASWEHNCSLHICHRTADKVQRMLLRKSQGHKLQWEMDWEHYWVWTCCFRTPPFILLWDSLENLRMDPSNCSGACFHFCNHTSAGLSVSSPSYLVFWRVDTSLLREQSLLFKIQRVIRKKAKLTFRKPEKIYWIKFQSIVQPVQHHFHTSVVSIFNHISVLSFKNGLRKWNQTHDNPGILLFLSPLSPPHAHPPPHF